MSERTAQLQELLFDPTSSLLTAELEALRLAAPVAEYSVKGDPRKPPGDSPRYKDLLATRSELEAVQGSMFNPYDIHAECEGPGRVALIRKMSPHGTSEMTVMAQEGHDGQAVTSLFGFAPEVRSVFCGVGAAFGEFSETRGLYPVVSYTFDPDTKDRKSAQSVKTYHMQLTARSPEELDGMAQASRPLGEYASNVERRQLIDESSIVYSLVLHDYFTAHPVGSLQSIPPFSADNCSNVRFRIGDRWSDIQTDEFDQNIRTIHDAMTKIYTDFSNAAMSGETGNWERPDMSTAKASNYIDNLAWMQADTKAIFQHYILGLRVKHLQRVESLKKLGLTAHAYPLAGLCYGTAINRNTDGELMLSIRPQQFVETGGTGLQYIDPTGAHVKMARGSGMYDQDELAAKAAFEKECAVYIVQSV
ncbi:MAG TPA: hypothetical protein VGO07_00540 [Candidatus Saccharimonadales bacterium]|jgi:hypothetical protein|nr:hypothetical protein [Candidatus Saccharimonadales bacterium]